MANIVRSRQRANEAGVVIVPNSGNTHTVSVIDRNCVLSFSAATPVTVTLPNSLPAGFDCWLLQDGAGAVTAVAAAGASAVSPGNPLSTSTQYASLYCLVLANADGLSAIWDVTGAGGGSGGGGTGTVTSVALVAPAEFTVSGSPVTTNGALTFAKALQVPHTVWAGPVSGGNAAPSFRTLQLTDLPPIDSGSVTNLGTFATQNYATPPPIGGTTPAPLTGTQVLATSFFDAPNGTVASPGYQFAPGLGWYSDGTNILGAVSGAVALSFSANVANVEGSATQTLVLHRTDAALASGDAVGVISVTGPNDSGTNKTWGGINVTARVATSGGETGTLYLQTWHGGGVKNDYTIDSGILYAGGTPTTGKQIADASGALYATNFTVTDPAAAPVSSILLTATGSNGANFKMVGDGATTPSKTLRTKGGNFQIVNSGYTLAILTLSDTGDLSVSSLTAQVGPANKSFSAPGDNTAVLTGVVGSPPTYIGQRSEATLSSSQQAALFQGAAHNSAGTLITYGSYTVNASTPTAGSEIGTLWLQSYHGGALVTDFSIQNGNLFTGNQVRLLADNLGNLTGVNVTATSAGTAAAPSLGVGPVGNGIGLYSATQLLGFSNSPTATQPVNLVGNSILAFGTTAAGIRIGTANTNLAALQVMAGNTYAGLNISRWDNSNTFPILALGKSRSTTVGTPGGAVTSGTNLGSIQFAADDGTTMNTVAAQIWAQCNGAVSTGIVPTALIFTTQQGANDFCMSAGSLYAGGSVAGKLLLDGVYSYANPAPTWQRLASVNNFNVVASNGMGGIMFTPAGTLATGAITMPSAPVDQQEWGLASSTAITALTMSAAAGQTLAGAITTLAANGFARWKYFLATTTWYRVG